MLDDTANDPVNGFVGNGLLGVNVINCDDNKCEAVTAYDADVEVTAIAADIALVAFPYNEPLKPAVDVIDPVTVNEPVIFIDSVAAPSNTLYISET